MNNYAIPEQVKRLRGSRTLKTLANETGLSISYLSDIERGRTVPTIETLDKIFAACGARVVIGYEYIDGSSDYVSVVRTDIDALRELVEKLTHHPASAGVYK